MMKTLQSMKRATGQCMAGFAMLLLIGTGAVAPAGAATINVTANAPDLSMTDFSCSLREAIANINNGANTNTDCTATGQPYGTNDIINLPAGTYTTAIVNPVAAEEDFNANGDMDIRTSVAIAGAGMATTIINANGFLTGDRVFDINPQGAAVGVVVVSISGVTILGGATLFHGGGIRNSGRLTITNATISNNSAQFGASLQNGGGIFSKTGRTLTVTNSTISGNFADAGGGISNQQGTLSITNSTISSNTANLSGGGITNSAFSLSFPAMFTVMGSTIDANTANKFGGGGISNDDNGILGIVIGTITNSTISGNISTGIGGGGGGIVNNGQLTITNSTISGNTTSRSGGGIAVSHDMAIIRNSTITANSAATAFDGGGITIGAGTVSLKNTIVANQVLGSNCAGGLVTTPLNSLDSDGTCGVAITANPLLGSLANNGGPTLTHALLPGSPAIDAGDAATCAAAPVNSADQRGVIRPQGTSCDIGAFELQLGPLPVVGLNLNRSSFATGSTMTVTASTTPGFTPVNADVYVALQLPDGTLLVMQPDGSFSTVLTPLVANIPIPAFTGPIFNFTFTGAEPLGNYTWFAALTTPGTLNVIGAMAIAPFAFAP